MRINLDGLHAERLHISFVHQKMHGRYQVAQICIDTDIIAQHLTQIQNILAVPFLREHRKRHIGIEKLEKLIKALLIMFDRPLSQIPLPAIVQIPLTTFLKSQSSICIHLQFSHCKTSSSARKSKTHHRGFLRNDGSNY